MQGGIPDAGRRARFAAERRREAESRHRQGVAQGSPDHDLRRGHLFAGHAHGEGDHAEHQRGGERPDQPRHRAPPVHHHGQQRDHRAQRRGSRGARGPPDAVREARGFVQDDVGQPAAERDGVGAVRVQHARRGGGQEEVRRVVK